MTQISAREALQRLLEAVDASFWTPVPDLTTQAREVFRGWDRIQLEAYYNRVRVADVIGGALIAQHSPDRAVLLAIGRMLARLWSIDFSKTLVFYLGGTNTVTAKWHIYRGHDNLLVGSARDLRDSGNIEVFLADHGELFPLGRSGEV